MWLEWSHVTKIYDCSHQFRRIGLLDFSATARKGITVVLGEKGSGKSTLLRITSTLMLPDDGRIIFRTKQSQGFVWSRGCVLNAGISYMGDVKGKIAYIPDAIKLEHDSTVEESLLYLAQLKRIPYPKRKTNEMLARWGLASFRKESLERLDGSVLKRYLFAQSLIGNPYIWLLDEPTKDLDEWSKSLLMQELSTYGKHSMILIATQDMQLAECAHDLILMEAGTCRRMGRKKFLTASVPEGTVEAWYRMMQQFSGSIINH